MSLFTVDGTDNYVVGHDFGQVHVQLFLMRPMFFLISDIKSGLGMHCMQL